MGWFPRVVLFLGALCLLYPVMSFTGTLKGNSAWTALLAMAANNAMRIIAAGFLMLVACLGRLPW